MTTLLLARHGETDWNRERRWQGHADTPLNDRGREQARELAGRIERADAIYSSDLARARETAEIVAAKLGVEVRTDARLRERAFGAWEGLRDDEVAERFPEDLARLTRGDGTGAADAEPHEDFRARVHAFLDDVLRRHPNEDVLIVGHGGSIRVIHALAAGVDYLRDRRSLPDIVNCGLSRCAVRDGKLARID